MPTYIDVWRGLKRISASVTGLLIGSGVFLISEPALGQTTSTASTAVHVGPTVPKLPEVNVGLVLIPLLFIVLLVSWRQLFRKREAQKR